MREGAAPERTWKDYLLLGLKGFIMGASDVIPGVSGGTMAFILGIYEELIDAIRSFNLKSFRLLASLRWESFRKAVAWPFLLAVGVGILTAIFSLARVLEWLLQNRPVLIWSFFFGLIVASMITVGRRVGQWRAASRWLGLGLGAAGTYILVGLVPVSTPQDPWFLFLSGAVAICAMILPGISGSFVLVLLGKYQHVLSAVNQRDLVTLGLVAAGALFGIAAFSRLLAWLFRRYHDLTVVVLTGLMLGSLRKVWPWKETLGYRNDSQGHIVPLLQVNILPRQWGVEETTAICLMILGFLVVLLLERMGDRSRGTA
ncbi:MAG: DUF368 domain-containing protein [Deltaproteobacteria bacterium]|nr:DUF368 domain-containing protein [Deltaproteobacteria bacterium]